jgi:hypothetical protein
MRFLADERCDFAAVRELREHGHDVVVVSEFQNRSVDKELMDRALAENRILLSRPEPRHPRSRLKRRLQARLPALQCNRHGAVERCVCNQAAVVRNYIL